MVSHVLLRPATRQSGKGCRAAAHRVAAHRLGMQHQPCPAVGVNEGNFHVQLVLATASAARPDPAGSETPGHLNSQQEFAAIEAQLRQARRILVLGAGLSAGELAMDMASAGKEVTLVDLADSP